ncbi:MAG: RNA-binding S4 domain-containing protein [Alistipes timonensis]|nr:RNA-binding S4 domain-containing protein [Alistipes timonensis]
MEANEPRKPRRPRIGQSSAPENSENNSYEKNFNAAATDAPRRVNPAEGDNASEGGYRPRPQGYQPRYNNQEGGYKPRYNNQEGGYKPRYNNQEGGYKPRYNNQEGGYKPRYNNQEGGYKPRYNNQEGGYKPRYNNQEGGYQPRQNGYNRYNNQGYKPRYNSDPAAPQQEGAENAQGQNPQEGGYQPRQHNGYNNNRQGGYGNNRQGGYNNNRQGGYNNNRQGGYGNNRQGGYNNNRQGGYNNNRPGGYGNNRPNNRYGNNGPVRQGKSFTPRPKRIEYELPLPDPNEQIRLNKFMANAGICSRREADEFIQQGLVKVNGQVVTELGTKISHDDTVEYDEKVVALESKCYILLNKPKDCVTTSDDPNGRTTVLDLVKGACNERIYPVGRLDRNTTGVLLLTNDGDLASKLTHPKYVKKKIYHVWTDKDIAEEDMQRIADGIELEDGPIHADAISYATDTDRNQAGIEIHSGRNRIVRRIFESLGYHVTKLDRVYFAGLTKKNLPRGRWRYLTQEEVNFLKMGSFE